MEKRKGQNSVRSIALLRACIGIVLFSLQSFAQQSGAQSGVGTCSGLSNNVRELESKYLWFNHWSIDEYAHLLRLMLKSFPKKKADIFNIKWSPGSDSRPFRSLSFINGADEPYDGHPTFAPVSLKAREEVEDDILVVGNGLPGKKFEFSFKRDAAYSNFRLEMTLPDLDDVLVQRAYLMALDEWNCDPTWDDRLLNSTKIEVNGGKLIFTSKFITDSIEKYLSN